VQIATHDVEESMFQAKDKGRVAILADKVSGMLATKSAEGSDQESGSEDEEDAAEEDGRSEVHEWLLSIDLEEFADKLEEEEFTDLDHILSMTGEEADEMVNLVCCIISCDPKTFTVRFCVDRSR
jgi:hypothetical protein